MARLGTMPSQAKVTISPSTKEWASRNPLQTLTATTTNTASGPGRVRPLALVGAEHSARFREPLQVSGSRSVSRKDS